MCIRGTPLALSRACLDAAEYSIGSSDAWSTPFALYLLQTVWITASVSDRKSFGQAGKVLGPSKALEPSFYLVSISHAPRQQRSS